MKIDTQSKATGLLAIVAVFAIALMAFVAFAPTAEAQYTFAVNLKQGSVGADVLNLQKVLNMNAATQVSVSGAGAPGAETTYFGTKTKAAVIKFQELYASEILAPVGLTRGTGYVGPSTRAKLNSMSGTSGSTSTVPGCTSTVGYSPTTGQKCDSGTTTVPSTGGALQVMGASQPANALAVELATRVPFTRITLTAGASAVTVNSITVERTGPANDAVFSGVVLLDEVGNQIGIAKTLNSNHQTSIGDAITIPAGTSRTLTIGGNMVSDLSSYAGQVVGLNVVAVNTNGSVSGSLPVSGALHTVNSSLTIGTATVAVSSLDPNSAQTKEIGTSNYKFSGFRMTAGSAEQVRLRSVRWNQVGSAGAGDIANVTTYVDGVAYAASVDSTGKYYTTNFGSGIVLDKGLGKDVYVQADIVGSGAANRTVQFDIYKATDIYVTGETYGYGITATAPTTATAGAGSQFTTGTPFFDGSAVTISAGSVTTIAKATSVAAQNIAINVPSQVLGGYEIDLKGEPISVQSHVFYFTSTSGTAPAAGNVLTSVSLYGPNGNVVAGPVDATVVAGTNQKATFTDTVTYPIGKGLYTLKGKVDADVANGTTYVASTTPSTDWTTVTGQTTGNTISLSTLSSIVAMNTMTVKSGALAITVSPSPAAQTVTAGSQNVTFANYQLDATQSGEDVRFSSIPLKYTFTGTNTDVTACQLFDGSTALTTGSNVVNPDVATGNEETFTLDAPLTVAKGTVKTITLKCNITSAATGTYNWGIAASPTVTVTGVTSGNEVTETVTASVGQIMTVGTGSFTVTKDASSPAYTVVAGGQTGVTMGVLRFTATNEAINLEKVRLQLTNTASSSPNSLVNVYLYDGATQVATAAFTGANTIATSSTMTGVQIPKDGSKLITIKTDLANIGTGQATSSSGALVAIDYDGACLSCTTGTGASSGTTINSSSASDTAMEGVRVMKSYPTVAKQTSSMSSTLIAQGGVDLYRFSVAANSSGDVTIYKFAINVATSSATTANGTTTVSNLLVKAYTDPSFSSIVSGYTDGQVVSTIASVNSGDNDAVLSTALTIPAGATRYFRVVGDVSQVAGTTGSAGTVTTRVAGDAAYPALANLMAAAATIDSDANDDFIWSPNSTTSPSNNGSLDWTNGYQIPGLPSAGTDSFTLTK